MKTNKKRKNYNITSENKSENFELVTKDNSQDKENIIAKEHKPFKKVYITIAILTISVVILILISLFLGYKLHKKRNIKCDNNIKVVETAIEPDYKYINYEGYTFKIPLDFSFSSINSEYKLINSNKTIYISFSKEDILYSEFTSANYQKEYIEKLQQENNILIKKSSSRKNNNIDYYLLEGTYDTYSYMIIILNREDGIFKIEVQYIDNTILNSNRDKMIDFALSYKKDI